MHEKLVQPFIISEDAKTDNLSFPKYTLVITITRIADNYNILPIDHTC